MTIEANVLMLDAGYQPIDVKPWQEVMVDWCNDKIEIVAECTERIIHRGREIYLPLIARFKDVIGPLKRAVKFSRDNLFARDKGRCRYCNLRVARDAITYDHVTPKSKGGKTNWTNIVICCAKCNQKKRNRAPEQAGMRVLGGPVIKPKSLPPRLDPRLLWRPGMPHEWSVYMTKDQRASAEYWHGALDEDA